MPKPILGLVLGIILGAIDGLTALFYPETAPLIAGIVMGSSVKGLIAGLLIGWFANKVPSIPKGVLFGGIVGLVLAFLIAVQPDEQGRHWYAEIMIPGTVVGLILGYATQRYGREPRKRRVTAGTS